MSFNLKSPIVLLTIGILAGYSLSRVLDTIPGIRSIPKIRV